MIKKLLIVLLIILVAGIIYFFVKYPNNVLVPYRPQGPSYQSEENQQNKGYPARQLDQTADSVRKFTIQDLDQALKKYYSINNKAPETLEDLISAGYIKSVKVDKVTNQPPKYYPKDSEHGCRVELILSDGSSIYGYCK